MFYDSKKNIHFSFKIAIDLKTGYNKLRQYKKLFTFQKNMKK